MYDSKDSTYMLSYILYYICLCECVIYRLSMYIYNMPYIGPIYGPFEKGAWTSLKAHVRMIFRCERRERSWPTV